MAGKKFAIVAALRAKIKKAPKIGAFSLGLKRLGEQDLT